MKSTTKLSLAFAMCATAILANSASAAIVNVSPGNMGSWAFYSTDSSGVVGTGTAVTGMVNGPGLPPLGTGSAHLMTGPGAGDGSGQLRNSDWAGTSLTSLTSLSYSTYATAWNGAQLPWLRLYLDFDADGLYDDRLVFEPEYSNGGYGNGDPNPQPVVALNTWQTWNVLNGMVYSDVTGGPGADAVTFATYLSAHATATIVNDNGQGIGGIRFTAGIASPGDNFNAYVDNFTIGTSLGTTTYDFELAPVPEPTTMIAGALLLLPFGFSTLRKLRKNRTA